MGVHQIEDVADGVPKQLCGLGPRPDLVFLTLDQQLTARDEEAQLSLDQAYTHIKGKLKPGADWERQLLRDAYQEIEQNWPIIMLLPNGPYEMVLKTMVEALEADAGAGGLSTEQGELYDIARALVDAFRGNSRGNEMSARS